MLEVVIIGFSRSRYWDHVWRHMIIIRDQCWWRTKRRENWIEGEFGLWYMPGNTLANLQGVWSKNCSLVGPSLGRHEVPGVSGKPVTLDRWSFAAEAVPDGVGSGDCLLPALVTAGQQVFWEGGSVWYTSMFIMLFSLPVVSNSLWPHRLQHTRPLCPSPSPEVCPRSCSLHRWCHQPSHPLTPSSSACNLFQHQGLFQSVRCSHQMTKILEFQLQFFQQVFRIDFPWDWLV